MQTRTEYNLLDNHFARFLADRSHLTGTAKDRFGQLVRALTAAQDGGHACLPITKATKSS